MKKILSAIIFVFIIMLTATSCARTAQKQSSDGTAEENSLAALESQLAELRSEYAASDAESRKRIAELQAQIDAMSDDTIKDKPQDTQSPAEPSAGFTYTVTDGYATITGYVGDETALVIPATIDGYRVISIGDNAFEDRALKSVIISNGVQSIGWFAFNGCVKLTSVTVPSSVESIGYSAFGNAGSSLTVYCHSQSFALAYAKSYGLTYAII